MTQRKEPQYKILVVDDDTLTRCIARQELENDCGDKQRLDLGS